MGESSISGTANVLVLNALANLVDPSHDVIADADSRSLIEDVFEDAVDETDAEAFRRVVRSLTDLSIAEYRERDEVIDRVVETVCEYLDRREVTVIFDHESAFEFTEREVALYSYIVSPTTDIVADLGLAPDCESVVRDGVASAAEGDYADAAEVLDGAIEADPPEEDLATLQALAGWAHFWAGDDQRATDLAGQALDRAGDLWHLKPLWIVSTHQYADQFRDGRLIVRLIFNWMCELPEGTSIDLEVGLGTEGELAWETVDVESDFHVFEDIAPYNGYRFRLRGTVDRFPDLPGYYVGLATVYPEWHEIREIERTLHSGPETADPTERVAFRPD